PEHPDPGRITIRRLNRTEYNNTIRDLVGIDFHPGDDFPADDTGYGFDTIGDVLSLPPALFERYLAAAEKIMSAAILNDHKPRSQTLPVDFLKDGGDHNKGQRWVDQNEAKIEANCPLAGEYTLKLELQASKTGDENTKVEVKLDDKIPGLPQVLTGSSD